MTHALKIEPEYFKAVNDEVKMFELRKDDRPFQLGDKIILQEYIPEKEQYTGSELTLIISYILRDVPKIGLKAGYCILGLTIPTT